MHVQGSELGWQAWLQVPLPAEPSHQPCGAILNVLVLRLKLTLMDLGRFPLKLMKKNVAIIKKHTQQIGTHMSVVT